MIIQPHTIIDPSTVMILPGDATLANGTVFTSSWLDKFTGSAFGVGEKNDTVKIIHFQGTVNIGFVNKTRICHTSLVKEEITCPNGPRNNKPIKEA